jgi:hypothetical protein
VQRPLTSGPRGWPAGQTHFQPAPPCNFSCGWLRDDTLQEEVEGNPKLKIGGGQTPWLVGHVARPAGYHLACY